MKPAINNLFPRKVRDSQRGAVAVEFAIVLPLFAILLLGTVEIGLMARDHQVLQNAARDGARFSGLPAQKMSGSANASAILQTIQNRVVAYLQNEGITVPAGNIVVDEQYPITVGGLTIYGSHITVTYTRSVLFPGTTTFFSLGSIVLQGDAVFRNFYPND
jgi:Flp pilus assembly protein TadG